MNWLILISFMMWMSQSRLYFVHNRTLNLQCQDIPVYDESDLHMIYGCIRNSSIQFFFVDLMDHLIYNYSDVLTDLSVQSIKTNEVNKKDSGEVMFSKNNKPYIEEVPINLTSAPIDNNSLNDEEYTLDDKSQESFLINFNTSMFKQFDSNFELKENYTISPQIFDAFLLQIQGNIMMIYAKKENNYSQFIMMDYGDGQIQFSRTYAYFPEFRGLICFGYVILLVSINKLHMIEIYDEIERVFFQSQGGNIVQFVCVNELVAVTTDDQTITFIQIETQNNLHQMYFPQTNYTLIQIMETSENTFSILSNSILTRWEIFSSFQDAIDQYSDFTIDDPIRPSPPPPTPNPPPPSPTPNPPLSPPLEPEPELELEPIAFPSTPQQIQGEEIVQQLRPAAESTGTVLAATSMKTSFKFLGPIFSFLDDLWLYNFHNNVTYSKYMLLCMSEADMINIIKNKPSYVKFLDDFFNLEDKFPNNEKYLPLFKKQMRRGVGLDLNQVYFLDASKDILVFGNLSNFSVFFCFIVFKKIFKFICLKNKESNFWKAMYLSFCEKTKTWVLISLIIDSGLIRLSFYSFNQLSWFIYLDFQSKINCIAAAAILFFIVVYSLSFFLIIKRFHKNTAPNLLSFSKINFHAYLFENLICNFSKVLYSFCHSNLLLSHSLKMKATIMVNIFFIFWIIRFRNAFMNKITFIINLLYNLVFLALNIFILFHWNSFLPLTDQKIKEIIDIIIFFLIGIMIINIIKGIIDLIIDICCDNSSSNNTNQVFPLTNIAKTVKKQKKKLKEKKEKQKKKEKKKEKEKEKENEKEKQKKNKKSKEILTKKRNGKLHIPQINFEKFEVKRNSENRIMTLDEEFLQSAFKLKGKKKIRKQKSIFLRESNNGNQLVIRYTEKK